MWESKEPGSGGNCSSDRLLDRWRLDGLLSRLDSFEVIGLDAAELFDRATQRQQQLQAQPHLPTVLLAEADPTDFLAGLIAAVSTQSSVILGNPTWSDREWQQVFEQVCPDLIWADGSPAILGSDRLPSAAASPTVRPEPGWILIPTGGSSGNIRFAVHTLHTLTTSVRGFQDYFEVERIDSCCILPLYHVSGLMQFWRSFLTGGKLAIFSYSSLLEALSSESPVAVHAGWSSDAKPSSQTSVGSALSDSMSSICSGLLGVQENAYFLSLVPTQLQRLISHPAGRTWLQSFATIFLGGAPAWPDLLDTARSHRIRLAPTYGMTETAAQVATLKPDDFLGGKTGCGQVLPHAAIGFRDQSIVIRSPALMLGYFPKVKDSSEAMAEFLTDDCGYFDADGSLQITGRSSQKIITGGENVFPIEVETAVRRTGLIRDICVIGMPDQTWGEAVVACYVPTGPEVTPADLKAAIAPLLSPFKRPKQWILVDQIPRNAQGKINYAQLKVLAQAISRRQSNSYSSSANSTVG